MTELPESLLEQVIYAARDSERYWKNRKNRTADYLTQEHYDEESLQDKVLEAKALVKVLESLRETNY